jgi:hypothetical protein
MTNTRNATKRAIPEDIIGRQWLAAATLEVAIFTLENAEEVTLTTLGSESYRLFLGVRNILSEVRDAMEASLCAMEEANS